MRVDLRAFIDSAAAIVDRHNLGAPGEYRRWPQADAGLNPYGTADAANILHTIGRWPSAAERGAWVDVLCGMQQPATGLFHEDTHHPFHTTAHCTAALELFDAGPAHSFEALAGLRHRPALEAFLDALEWTWNPWGESHRGAGLYAALVIAGEVSADWQDWYFDWLWGEADADSGFWRRGCVAAGGDGMLFHHLAGSFHYLFNHEHARRALRFPERMVDSCLRIHAGGLFPPLGKTVGFAEVDWVYCLSRACRQSGHRFAESREVLREFARDYLAYLRSLDPGSDPGLNDLHQLFGALCALAELQQALPGELRSEAPLRLVLDRRPFI